jgi:hypothetical protein
MNETEKAVRSDIKPGATLPQLERILRLLSNALRRTIDGDPNAETPQDKRDTDEINRSYVAEAKELLTDLAKHDSATFTRHQNPPGWQAANVELAAEEERGGNHPTPGTRGATGQPPRRGAPSQVHRRKQMPAHLAGRIEGGGDGPGQIQRQSQVMTVETYNGVNIYYVRQEGTGAGVTYNVGTWNGHIYERGLKTRAEAIAYIDELSVGVDADFIKALLAKDVLPE